MLYQNLEQATLRLSGTIVLYNDIFVDVLSVHTFRDYNLQAPPGSPDICLKLYDPSLKSDPQTGRYRFVPIDDPKLRYTNILLGYFNTPSSGAFYASRRPARAQKQGLVRENSSIYAAHDTAQNNGFRINELAKYGGLLIGKITDAKAISENLVHNRYPDVESSVKFIRNHDTATSRAVSRHLCLMYDRDLDVVYVLNRGVRIGMWYPKSGLNLNGRNKCFAEEAAKIFPKVTVNDSEAA